MTNIKSTATIDLVDRLGEALAGSHGRTITIDSLKSLVQIEVLEWRTEGALQTQNAEDKSALLNPKSEIKS